MFNNQAEQLAIAKALEVIETIEIAVIARVQSVYLQIAELP